MSSLLGHASTGLAFYLSRSTLRAPAAPVGLAVCVLLALAPDADYVAYWLVHVNSEPRWTHTLLFALATSWLAWWALALANSPARALGWPILAAAACSHPLLDLLVGVHPVPVLWPGPQWMAPIGLLPSAVQRQKEMHCSLCSAQNRRRSKRRLFRVAPARIEP